MPAPASYAFGRFEFLPAQRKLLVDGRAAAVGGRALDLLLTLVEQPDRMLTKDELLDRVWPDAAVEPNNLAVQIGALRKLLGPDAIATIPGRGYRFGLPLDATPRLAPALTMSAPAQPLQPVRLKTNLPEVPTALIGRTEALAALETLLDRHALVTITGAGGIGKSLVTQHLLHRRRDAYPHGVCWVELAAVSDPAALPGALASALDLQLGGGDATAALCSVLGPLAMLIALDNAEHLLDAVSALAAALNGAAPMVRVVVTSQAPLHVAREWVYQLDALAVPQGPVNAGQAIGYSAVALFVDRAQAADARFRFDDSNAAAVVDLCRRLDGLPLAIELAAARAPVLGVQRIIESLGERLQLLTAGRRDAPARQQTLRAALDWSHGLLGAHERIVFRRLAVIAGSGSLELIQRIAADDDTPAADASGRLDRWAVLEALSSLIDRSLVSISAEGDNRERPRYQLLDSPRAYAEERLREAGETDPLAERHARAVGDQLAAAWEERYSGRIGGDAWSRSLQPDRANARAALAWALAKDDRPLVLQIAPAMLMRGLAESSISERSALADTIGALLPTEPVTPEQLPTRLLLITFRHNRQPQQRLEEARRCVQVAREGNDRFMLYRLTAIVAQIAYRLGDGALVDASIAELHAIEDPGWPPHKLQLGAEAYASCAGVAGGGSAPDLALWDQMFALADAGGFNVDKLRGNVIDQQLTAGDVAGAVTHGRELVAQLAHTRDELPLVMARLNLAAALLEQGDVAEAKQFAKAGWPSSIGFDCQPFYADYLALTAALEERWNDAASLVGYAEAAYARLSMARWPNETRAFERATALTRSALGAAEFERLMAEGALLRDAQIADIAFGTDAVSGS